MPVRYRLASSIRSREARRAGSLVGFVIYMRFSRDMGSVRSGLHAFVSPVIAVALGAVLRREPVIDVSIAGMVTLLRQRRLR